MAEAIGISTNAFDKWGVEPVEKTGRQNLYSFKDVITNRVAHETAKLVGDKDQEDWLDPVQEKAKLDHEKRRGAKLQNDEKEGSLFPVVAAQFVFAKMGSEIASKFDGLPALIKKILPETKAAEMDRVKKVIAEARNTAVEVGSQLNEFIEEYNSEAD